AGVPALPVHEPQGRDHDLADRGDRRRVADRRPGRHRRPPAGRLLLRPDRTDLGGAVRSGAARPEPGRARRLGRAMGRTPDGGAAMTARSYRALALAAWRPAVAVPRGLIIVGILCTVTLVLLGDVAGAAGFGFWALVLINWLAASLVVMRLAAS